MTWRQLNLGQAIHVKHGFAFKGEFFVNEGVHIVLTPGNFYEAGGFRMRPGKDRYYSGDVPSAYVLKAGDLIVAMTEQGPGLLGSSAFVPEDNRYLHNQRLGLIDWLDEEVLDKRFLCYLMNTNAVRAQISGSASGTKVRHTAPERIYRVSALVPDVPTQRHIADILSAYDDLIENNRRRIALLEQAARELYREWFVRLRFPGHEHVKVVDGVPEEWTRVRLGSLTTKIGSGATPRGGEASYKSSGTALFRSQNIYDYRFDPAGLAFIDDEQAKALSNVEVQSGDVLLNITGASVGRCCLAPRRFLPGRVNQHVMIIRADRNRVTSQFLLHAINSPENKGLLMNIARAGGATREALTKDDISDFFIRVPTPALLEIFDNQVASIFDQQEVLANQNDCLANARDLLLPRLMNGSIAV